MQSHSSEILAYHVCWSHQAMTEGVFGHGVTLLFPLSTFPSFLKSLCTFASVLVLKARILFGILLSPSVCEILSPVCPLPSLQWSPFPEKNHFLSDLQWISAHFGRCLCISIDATAACCMEGKFTILNSLQALEVPIFTLGKKKKKTTKKQC